MGFFKDLVWFIRSSGQKDEADSDDGSPVAERLKDLPCRAPNMTGETAMAGGSREDPLVVKARIMAVRGVVERWIAVDDTRCTLCGQCVEVCPDQAASIDGKKLIDPRRCTTCGCCIASCPGQALRIEETSALDP